MYKPDMANYEHWALYLEDKDINKVFHVVGAHLTFTADVTKAKPTSTSRFKQCVFVSDINSADVE